VGPVAPGRWNNGVAQRSRCWRRGPRV